MRKKTMPVEHICGNENCCAVFYGRANAVYCTRRCREAATKRRHRARPKPSIHLAERMGYRPGDPEAVSSCGLRGRVLSENIEEVSCSNCRRMHRHGRRGRARVLRQVRVPFGQVRWVSG